MKKILPVLLCCLFIFVPAIWVKAQAAASGTLEVEAGLNHAFKAGIKDSDASVSRTRYGFRASCSHFTLGYDYTRYSWDNHQDLGLTGNSLTPWDDMHYLFLTANRNILLSQEWMLNLGGGISSAFEREMSDSFGLAARVMFFRLFESGWSAGIGLAGACHPVRSIVLPALSLGYGSPRDPGLSFRIGFPATEMRYVFTDTLALRAGADFNVRAYRLKNDSQVAEKGYFREQAVKLSLDAEIRPMKNMTLSMGPYFLLAREWKIYDQDKNRIGKEEFKNRPGLKTSLSWRF